MLLSNEKNNKEKALLNKIYRAVHDCVCPKCGHDMDHVESLSSLSFNGYMCRNRQCNFDVSDDEMNRMRGIVIEWGAEAVRFFDDWRNRGSI